MAGNEQAEVRVPVLLVDDEPQLLETLGLILESRHFAVTPCLDADCARAAMARERYALLITDLNLPGGGDTIVRFMRQHQPPENRVGIIVITGYIGREDIAPDLRQAADAILHKPLDIATLLDTMAGLLQR